MNESAMIGYCTFDIKVIHNCNLYITKNLRKNKTYHIIYKFKIQNQLSKSHTSVTTKTKKKTRYMRL